MRASCGATHRQGCLPTAGGCVPLCARVWSAMRARAAFACGRQTWVCRKTAVGCRPCLEGLGAGWARLPFRMRATCAQLLMHRLCRCLVFACSSCQCMSACFAVGGRLRADYLWGGGVLAWLGAHIIVQMRTRCGATNRKGCVLTSGGCSASVCFCMWSTMRARAVFACGRQT